MIGCRYTPYRGCFDTRCTRSPPARLIVGLVGLMLQASGLARADGLRRTPIDARRGPDDLRDR
jgi:hypothetical protein